MMGVFSWPPPPDTLATPPFRNKHDLATPPFRNKHDPCSDPPPATVGWPNGRHMHARPTEAGQEGMHRLSNCGICRIFTMHVRQSDAGPDPNRSPTWQTGAQPEPNLAFPGRGGTGGGNGGPRPGRPLARRLRQPTCSRTLTYALMLQRTFLRRHGRQGRRRTPHHGGP